MGPELLTKVEAVYMGRRFIIRMAAVATALSSFVFGCVTTSKPSTNGLVVRVDGLEVHRGPAAFTVRTTGPQRDTINVVLVPQLGEVLVDVDRCRFVRADGGVPILSILEHPGRCAELRGEQLCFGRATFGKAVVIEIDGCADRNEVFLDRVGNLDTVGIAPRTLIERCVPVSADDPSYLRVVDISVAGSAQVWRDVRFRFDGDGVSVCFLSAKSGAYRVVVHVEEGQNAVAPAGRDLVIAGDVSDF